MNELSETKRYWSDMDGVIHLKTPKPFCYDTAYVEDRYNSYGEDSIRMSYLRYRFIQSQVDTSGKRILDVGYGNGDFLKVCGMDGALPYGYDVSGYPLPENIKEVENMEGSYDIITFFDSLENFVDIDFVSKLKTRYVCITVPLCHFPQDRDIDWFLSWKHLRPEEHFHHFSKKSLVSFMERMGYSLMAAGNPEDAIRGEDPSGVSNTLTALFVKEETND